MTTTLQNRITDFIAKALTRTIELHDELMEEFDFSGYQSAKSVVLLDKINDTYDFIELLDTEDYGQMSDRQISDTIDFFIQWLDLNKTIAASFTNYSLPIQNRTIILDGGEYALQADLTAEIAARAAADQALLDRIEDLEDNEPDWSELFPPEFFDNYVGDYSVVFDDDERLHEHSNKTQLDEINSDDIINIKALEGHYESIGEPDGMHVSPEDREAWNNAATATIGNIDGGNASTIYLITQGITGGNA